MAKRTYAVLGATGKTGHVVAEQLLRRGHDVRVIGREAGRLEPLHKKGAKPVVCNFDDATTLTNAFKGVDAVYLMTPPNPLTDDFPGWQEKVGKAVVAALKDAHVKHAVNLSSLGAELNAGTGPILGLHKAEKRLDAVPGLSVLHLRPAFFMENLMGSLPMLKTRGVFGGAQRGDVPFEMIATRDIGVAAADALEKLDVKGGGNVLELCGPTPVKFTDATKAIGEAIGRPDLTWTQLPYPEAEKGLVQAGWKPGLAALYTEMTHAFNDGKIKPVGKPYRGPTTLVAFTKDVFVPAYRAG